MSWYFRVLFRSKNPEIAMPSKMPCAMALLHFSGDTGFPCQSSERAGVLNSYLVCGVGVFWAFRDLGWLLGW